MADISNKLLAVVVTASIVLSLTYTITLLNTLSKFKVPSVPLTGKAQTQYGNVTLEIENQVSIILNDFLVDFGTGSVNTSCQQIQDYKYANLSSLATQNYVDDGDCWIDAVPDGSPFEVENNGNLNASVAVRGPSNGTFFYSPTSGFYSSYGSNLNVSRIAVRWNTSATENDACQGTKQSDWALLDQNRTMCSNLRWDDSSPGGNGDEFTVEVNVWIPVDLGNGVYNASAIEFYAVES